jgi:uncharacterized protein YidB (DUF937 family)
MGLTEILAGMVGGQSGAGAQGGQAQLLNLILSMLAGGGRGGGGLGGGLGGGGVGAGFGGGGGLDALLRQFREAGLGAQADSWVSTGPNLPVSGDQLRGAFGDAQMDDLAGRMGLSTGDLSSQMAQMLPDVVDRLTPQGRMPDGGFGGLDDLLGALLGRR